LVNALPRTFGSPTETFQIRGRETEEGSQAPQAFALRASPAYIDTFGIELVQGRFFNDSDRLEQAPVAVVNRSFSETWLAGENPLGRYVNVRDEARMIVGVVEDVQQVLLQTGAVQSEAIYTPIAQAPTNSFFLTLRSRGGDPKLLAEPLRSALRGLDPDLTLSQVLTMDEVTAQNFVGIDIFTTILGGFGILAILLAAVGSYSVLAYSVNQRRHEIGIRMALGAEGKSVVWMVARQGVLLAVVGLAMGGLFMIPLLGLIRSLMVGFATVSGGTSAVVAALLFGVTVIASLVPAYRAAHVNPVRALQSE
jgi:putative ABC transport system permease protein